MPILNSGWMVFGGPNKQFYHCFGCGAHGTAIGFLMEFDHMSFVEAIESLASSMGVEVPRNESDRPARRYDELFDLMSRVERFWQQGLRENPAAVDYLKQRGIDGNTAKRFGLGYATDAWSTVLDKFGTSQEAIDRLLAAGLVIRKDNGGHYDRFRDRIMFPIHDRRGRVIAFGGRALDDGGAMIDFFSRKVNLDLERMGATPDAPLRDPLDLGAIEPTPLGHAAQEDIVDRAELAPAGVFVEVRHREHHELGLGFLDRVGDLGGG